MQSGQPIDAYPHFTKAKLDLLKSTLTHDSINLPENIKNKITAANTLGTIWRLLFKKNLYPLYQQLNLGGIFPTSSELNELHLLNKKNAWYYLASTVEGRKIFTMLMKLGIFPAITSLSAFNSTDNTNAWHWLASFTNGCVIFKELLKLNIIPNTVSLSGCSYLNNANVWNCLARKEQSCKIIKELLKLNIIPDAKSLSSCHTFDNTNTWYWLTITESGREILKELIKLGIIPDAKSLSVCRTTNNTNAWHWLTKSESGREIFKELLDHGVIPSTESLLICNTEDNTNAWGWLANSESGREIFNELLLLGIIPSTESLSACHILHNYHAWLYLASDKKLGREIFKSLLMMGIYPSLTCLSILPAENNYDTWHYLQNYSDSTSAFICEKLNNVKNTMQQYNLKETHITQLISRDDKLDFYGFLYLFYLKTDSLPLEAWNYIAMHLSPIAIHLNKNIIEQLLSDENRLTFTKYHVSNELYNYSSYLSSHRKRAASLYKAVMASENPSTILVNQCLMSRRTTTAYENPISKYQTPFDKKIADESFYNILQEGYFFSRSMAKLKANPVSTIIDINELEQCEIINHPEYTNNRENCRIS
jgi:uncharacterized protein YutE (UPF0331/DUF86 family)